MTKLSRRTMLAALPACSALAQTDDWSDPAKLCTIPGIPQTKYDYKVKFAGAKLTPMRYRGTIAYVIEPAGKVDRERRWIWVSPMFLALRSIPGGVRFQHYVESFAAAGYHVVGLEVGTSCGSPAGADLYEKFYSEILMAKYKLNPKARMIGQSNGGMITYGYAFRHPEHVDRIFGIMPATDMRSWPGLEKVAGSERITPDGMRYPVAGLEELKARLPEFNPIDNLAPMAQAGIRIYHLHGDSDTLVPCAPNSEELVRRYRALGGQVELEIIKGLGHGGPMIFEHKPLLNFLLG